MTKYETEEENRDKRAAVLVIPAYLIGKAVVQTVFWGLVAMYGLYKVRQAGITIKGNYCLLLLAYYCCTVTLSKPNLLGANFSGETGSFTVCIG